MLSQKLARLNTKSVRNILANTCYYCSGNQSKSNWRTQWKDKETEWQSGFSLFQDSRGPSTAWLTLIQSDIDLRPSTIKKWWKKTLERKEIFEERFIPERHQILGGDLAAAHFIVHRGGAVRFFGNNQWVRQDENEEYDLPQFYDAAYCIEAIDASKMTIHYEGLGNILDLYKIKWLSVEGCPNFDDWCLDRISGAYRDSLEYLDIRNCPKVTARGLSTLYRFSKLEKLIISNDARDENVELVCLLLEDIFPKLQIEGVSYLPMPDSTEILEKEDSERKKVSS
ncbi:distal membrane-arm assembly complex protein 2 [Hetaerina americana]|uniref:distal membrane-arm assembly complex protein 2 n=1 Tax=Hetaerina americana TaxID=62018 RepID=UPI003A7F3B04